MRCVPTCTHGGQGRRVCICAHRAGVCVYTFMHTWEMGRSVCTQVEEEPWLCVHMCLQKERGKVCVPVSVHTWMRVGPLCRHAHIGVFAGVCAFRQEKG